MRVVLYRFDDPRAFPVLEGQTTARDTWRVTVTDVTGAPAISVARRPVGETPSSATLCFALPQMAIDGAPVRLGLELHGDGSGCRFRLDATDGRGPGFGYVFRPVSVEGEQTCWADVHRPAEYWDGAPPDPPDVLPPLQLHRLVVKVAPPTRNIRIALLRLIVTGDVRLISPGVA